MAGRLPASPLNLRTPMKGKPLLHCTAEWKEHGSWKDRAQVHKTLWQHPQLSIMEISDFSGRNIIILYIAVFKYSTTQQKCNAFLYTKVKKKFHIVRDREQKKEKEKYGEKNWWLFFVCTHSTYSRPVGSSFDVSFIFQVIFKSELRIQNIKHIKPVLLMWIKWIQIMASIKVWCTSFIWSM